MYLLRDALCAGTCVLCALCASKTYRKVPRGCWRLKLHKTCTKNIVKRKVSHVIYKDLTQESVLELPPVNSR